MRTTFVAGNWKMHGSKESIKELIDGLQANISKVGKTKVAVCPPNIYIDLVKQTLTNDKIKVGSQNICIEPIQGAYTGETSIAMVADMGCEYAIIGHSERRSIYGETDIEIAKKVDITIKAGVTPILCVGETLDQREANQVEAVIGAQLDAVLNIVDIKEFKNIVIAYEPVWAIGTGKTASAAQAQEVHAFIRSKLAKQNLEIASNIIIQYGGSVKPSNAKELFSQPDIDGGLIGGASLNVDDFIAICAAG